MFFMRFAIDAVFCDRDLVVLKVVPSLRPWRMASHRGAKVVIELAVSSPAAPANVRQLVTHAERGCHAAQSLAHPVPVHLTTTLNQRPLA